MEEERERKVEHKRRQEQLEREVQEREREREREKKREKELEIEDTLERDRQQEQEKKERKKQQRRQEHEKMQRILEQKREEKERQEYEQRKQEQVLIERRERQQKLQQERDETERQRRQEKEKQDKRVLSLEPRPTNCAYIGYIFSNNNSVPKARHTGFDTKLNLPDLYSRNAPIIKNLKSMLTGLLKADLVAIFNIDDVTEKKLTKEQLADRIYNTVYKQELKGTRSVPDIIRMAVWDVLNRLSTYHEVELWKDYPKLMMTYNEEKLFVQRGGIWKTPNNSSLN